MKRIIREKVLDLRPKSVCAVMIIEKMFMLKFFQKMEKICIKNMGDSTVLEKGNRNYFFLKLSLVYQADNQTEFVYRPKSCLQLHH